MRQPLLAPFAALALGIAVARRVPFGFTETLLSASLLAGLAWFAWKRRATFAGRAACLLAIALVGAQRASLPAKPDAQRVDAVFAAMGEDRETPVRLRGRVSVPPERFTDADRVVIEAESVYDAIPASGAVRVSFNRYPEDPPLELDYGERIEVLARFRKLRNFENPGSFDRVGYLHRQGIFMSATVRPRTPIHLHGNAGAGSIAALVWSARRELRRRFERLWGEASAEPILRALLLGDRSLLDRETTADFQRTGAYHVLVISGLHIGLLAFSLIAALRLVGVPSLPRAVLAMACVGVYVSLLGPRLPVTRAAAMLAAYLGAVLVFRRRRAMNVIAAVAAVFLLADPELLADAGFQMSFLAVALIAGIALPLLDRTVEPYRRATIDIDNTDRDLHADLNIAEKRVMLRSWLEPLAGLAPWPPWMTRTAVCGSLRLLCWVAALAIVSAVIQAGMALPMAHHFQRVSFTGIVSNIALIPIVTLVIPCGLFALTTGWTLPAAAAALGAHWIGHWTAVLASEVRLDLRTPPPPAWLAAAFLAALCWWGWSLRGRALRNATSRRRGTPAWPAVSTVAVSLALISLHPFPPRLEPGKLELSAIDVGQGESLLVVFPNGQIMLVDGGGLPDFGSDEDDDERRIDIGESVVSPYLWSRSIRRLDVLAVTHPDADHFDGIDAILENFDVGELWLGAGTFLDEYAALTARARTHGVPTRRYRRGARRAFGDSWVEVIGPPRNIAHYDDRNDLSLVLRVTYRDHDFLLTGDIEAGGEQRLPANLYRNRVEVLKVAHHGSRGSTSNGFLRKLDPMFALISAGEDNVYRHPHEELIERLADRHSHVLRTDLHGLVSILTDGRRISVRRRLPTLP